MLAWLDKSQAVYKSLEMASPNTKRKIITDYAESGALGLRSLSTTLSCDTKYDNLGKSHQRCSHEGALCEDPVHQSRTEDRIEPVVGIKVVSCQCAYRCRCRKECTYSLSLYFGEGTHNTASDLGYCYPMCIAVKPETPRNRQGWPCGK
jgi:hypothetical protein